MAEIQGTAVDDPIEIGRFIEMETHRQQFAGFLQRLANNEITLEDWDDHAVAHYFDKTLEDVRCDVVRLARARNGGPYGPEDKKKLMEWRELLLDEGDI